MKKILFLSIAFLLFRTVPTILSGRFTFAFDMGRDMLWVRNMVELRKPTLIGPWGSIAGVYFGPLWYYLLAFPYILFNGDPRGAVLVPLLSNIATLLIGWWYLRRKKHPIAATVWVLLYGFSPLVISTSEFPFHANLLPLVTLLFLIGLYSSSVILTRQKEGKNLAERSDLLVSLRWMLHPPTGGLSMTTVGLPLAAFMASVSYHLEPSAGIMLTLFFGCSLIFNLLKISWYTRTPFDRPSQSWTKTMMRSKVRMGVLLYSFIAFVIPFFPQLVFEFRHDFIQTKALVSYFRGENESLGGVLPLAERIPERVTKFSRTLSQSFLPLNGDWQKWALLGLFLVAVFWMMKKKSFERFTNNGLRFTFFFLLFHYFAYTFLFPAELKNWYLFGFASIFLLAIALMLERSFLNFLEVYETSISGKVILLIILSVWFYVTVNPAELVRSFLSRPTAASETLAGQLEAVDFIYRDAQETGQPFSVYTYTPPIYDYTYQYLLWWRGTREYGMLPAEFSYLPGETSYLPEKEKFVSKNWRPEDMRVLYKVIEPDQIVERLVGWHGHFSKFDQVRRDVSPIRQIAFPSGVTVGVLYLSEYPHEKSEEMNSADQFNPLAEVTPSPTPEVDPDETILMRLGKGVLSAIKNKEMEKLIPLMDKEKGVFFSLFYSSDGTTLFLNDFRNFFTDPTIHEWGTGASGFPSRMTKQEFYSGEVNGQPFNEPLFDQDYLNAPEVGVNKPVYHSGNSATIKEFTDGFYSGKKVKFVEYFFPGTEEYAEHDFSVLSLVFEKVGGRFVLVGVFKDSWTP